MKKEITPYLEKANEILYVLQKDGPMKPVDYATVIGLVAARVVEACAENGEDRQMVVDAMCKSVRLFSEKK